MLKLVVHIIVFELLLLTVMLGSPVATARLPLTTDSLASTFAERKVTTELIDSIYSRINTMDFIRSGEAKEELVDWLILQSEKLHYNTGIARGKNLKGVLFRDRSQYEEAISQHLSALELAGSDTTTLIYSFNNLGVVYRRLFKPRIALDYHLKALTLSEQFSGDYTVAKRSTCVALNSIGNINLSLDQPDRALAMFKKSLMLETELTNDLGVAINLQNIGYAWQAMGEVDSALIYFTQSLRYNEKINSPVGKSICLNSIGEVHLGKNQPAEALKNFTMAFVFTSQTNDRYYISQTHANLGKAHLALQNYDQAWPHLEQFNQMAKTINSGMLIKESHDLLSEYYEKIGRPQLALVHLRKALMVNDSIVNEKNSRDINELQTLYEADKKEQQIELLTAENAIKTQRVIMLMILIATLILLAIMVYFGIRKRNKQQKTELELKLFRSQMDPHFIFNALASIQSFMYQHEPVKAASFLGQFSSLTRSVLKNSARELVTLEEELETVRNYLEIEKMRKRDCFSYEIFVDEGVEVDFIFVPPIILQPFTENSIIHGFVKKECKEGFITIFVGQSDDYITISITDNGQGIKASRKNKFDQHHQSMGLTIFKERMRLIERKYKKTVKFEISDLSDKNPELSGTRVTIQFPIIEPDDQSRNNRRRTGTKRT